MKLFKLNRKNAKSQISKVGLLSTFFIVLLFSSCQKENMMEIELYTIDDKIEITEYLLDQGFHQDSIEFKADIVFVASNMGYVVEDLLKSIRGEIVSEYPKDPDASDMPASVRQRGISDRNNAVRWSDVNDVRYFIRPSVQNDCGNGWVTAIREAADRWNDIEECELRYIETTSQSNADIIIGSEADNILPSGLQNLPNNIIVAASGSLNGNPGEFISISDTHDGYIRKRRQIMIVFGITVGFEIANSSNGIHLHGTDISPSNSVMNTGWFASSNSFTDDDKRMARLFYPDGFHRPSNFNATSLGSGMVHLTYRNTDPIDHPYHWVRFAKYSAGGSILSVIYVNSTTTTSGNDSFVWTGQGSGIYRYAVRGCNYRRDAWSSRSSQVTINVN